jgi:outer membrane protein assembly factor BamA
MKQFKGDSIFISNCVWFLTVILFPLFLCFPYSVNASDEESPDSEKAVFSGESLSTYNGSVIQQIHIHGLERTTERAVKLLLGCREGETFTADLWIFGLKKLYNTSVLYDLRTEVQELSTSPARRIEIHLYLRDKWTLVPNVKVRSGGGATMLGFGGYNNNLGGYFTKGSFLLGTYSGHMIYDINQYQEWFLDTNYMFGVDLSRNAFPVGVQDPSGTYTQQFNWARTQQQFLFGRRFGSNVRLFSYFEFYQDSLIDQTYGPPAQIYTHLQYKIRPTLIIGRSNLTNYLEIGNELTIAPSAANLFSSEHAMAQLVMSYKRAFILSQTTNLAYYLNGGIMSDAPTPYQFRLGGFDSVRGFSMNRAIGTKYLYGNFEYRPTLLTHRFNWSALDFVAVQGCLFLDSGWMPGITLISAGAGIRLILVRFSGAIIRMDYARTLSPSEGAELSFSIGQFF